MPGRVQATELGEHVNFAFVQGFLGRYPLDEVILWIREHLRPEDVFTYEQLEIWSERTKQSVPCSVVSGGPNG